MYRWFLALRYLLQRPINLLGVIGVTLGVWALIVVVSIFSGYIVEIRSHIHSTTADVSISNLPPDCPFAAVRAVIEADPNVAACAPRIAWTGMLHPTRREVTADRPVRAADSEIGEDSRFLHLLGVDPEAELAVTGLREWLDATTTADLRVDRDRLLQPMPAAGDGDHPPRPTILLSERRAELEGLRAGDQVQVTCSRLHSRQAQTVDVESMKLVLQGAFATKYVLFDANTAILHIDTLRQLLGSTSPDACNVVAVKLRDQSQDVATAARLERALQRELQFGVAQDWQSTNSQILSAVDHQRSLMKLVLFVIMVVAAFLMYATLSMMVTEKVHDIGILSAIGATRYGILQVFLSCGLAIAAAGTVLGILTGCLSAIYLDDFNQWLRATFGVDLFPTNVYNLRHVPYDLDATWIAQVASMALGVGTLVSGVPAWRASRHDPVTSLRNE
jgi:lipoprotein-releasing system permease protein